MDENSDYEQNQRRKANHGSLFTVHTEHMHDLVSYGGMSASSHPWATAAGINMLSRGGNAVDAAVATAFSLAVVEPAMSHLGGQGNAIVAMAEEAAPVAIDFYATAPGASRPDMFRWIPGPTQGAYRFRTEGDLNTTGALSVGTPGAVAGWLHIHERWGKLPLATVIGPSIDYAEHGAPLNPRMAAFLAEEGERLRSFGHARSVWFRPDGRPKGAGEIIVQPELADTLRLISNEGADAFYEGRIARSIVDTVTSMGGILTAEDLAEYPTMRLRAGSPPSIPFRSVQVAAAPVSSAAVLLPLLRLLDGLDVGRFSPLDPRKIHLMIEAMKSAFSDRLLFSADPDFVNVPMEGLLSDGYMKMRLARIDTEWAGSFQPGDPWRYQERGPDPELLTPTPNAAAACGEADHTTHHSHVDRWGNMVSMTQSLGDAFGSAVIVPDRGFFLNNAMKLFDPRPGLANSIAPNKRPATAPCPTLVLRNGTPIMALGSPSGTRILNAIAQVLVHVFQHKLPLQQAVNMPRIHWSGDELEVEMNIGADLIASLEKCGHEVNRRNAFSPWFGAVQAVARDPDSGLCQGAADPRRRGAVAGVTILDDHWIQFGV